MKPQNNAQTRLHYLDWLRVLAMLGVFIFHIARPFDHLGWLINNSEQSIAATVFVVFLYPWGMPLFFLISGASTFFALKRRSYRQYVIERVQRLLIPFIVGSLILTPIQGYYEVIHKQLYSGTFIDFIIDGTVLQYFIVRSNDVGLGPRLFGAWGVHLWFLGFLFLYSLMAIPIIKWLITENGIRLLDSLLGIVSNRIGFLFFVIPLALIQILLNPIFPAQNDWADFLYQFMFFLYGYILFSDQRFLKSINKDWWIIVIISFVSSFLVLTTVASEFTDNISNPQTLSALIVRWGVYSINSWVWIVSLIVIGIRYLDFESDLLEYGKQAVIPIYLSHHPVIIAISFYVVQWDTISLVKFFSVAIGSFVLTFGLFEILIKRVGVLRNRVGVK